MSPLPLPPSSLSPLPPMPIARAAVANDRKNKGEKEVVAVAVVAVVAVVATIPVSSHRRHRDSSLLLPPSQLVVIVIAIIVVGGKRDRTVSKDRPIQNSKSPVAVPQVPIKFVDGCRWSPGIYPAQRLLGMSLEVAWERAFVRALIL